VDGEGAVGSSMCRQRPGIRSGHDPERAGRAPEVALHSEEHFELIADNVKSMADSVEMFTSQGPVSASSGDGETGSA